MPYFKSLFSFLLASATLSAGMDTRAYAEGGTDQVLAPTAPAVTSTKKAVVNVTSSKEVIQVLYLANESDLALVDLFERRYPEADLKELATEMKEAHTQMLRRMEETAKDKGVSLKREDLTETSKLVKTNVDRDVLILSEKPQEEVRNGFLSIVNYQYGRMLKILSEIEQLNEDESVRAVASEFRPLIEALLEKAESSILLPEEP